MEISQHEISHDEEFWKFCDELMRTHKIIIDRPRGSRHPKFKDMIYPLDYGYIEGTSSTDKEGIDVWIGTSRSGIIEGCVITVDILKADSEVKLLYSCSLEDIEKIIEMHNRSNFMKGLLVKR